MKWDGSVILATVSMLVILLAATAFVLFGGYARFWWILLIFWVIHLIPALFMPLGVGCAEDGVFIRRPIGRIVVPIEALKNVSPVGAKDLGGTRIVNINGLFGYLGLMRNERLGLYRLCATSRSDYVLIESERRKYVVSCPEREEFIAACQHYLDAYRRGNTIQNW